MARPTPYSAANPCCWLRTHLQKQPDPIPRLLRRPSGRLARPRAPAGHRCRRLRDGVWPQAVPHGVLPRCRLDRPLGWRLHAKRHRRNSSPGLVKIGREGPCCAKRAPPAGAQYARRLCVLVYESTAAKRPAGRTSSCTGRWRRPVRSGAVESVAHHVGVIDVAANSVCPNVRDMRPPENGRTLSHGIAQPDCGFGTSGLAEKLGGERKRGAPICPPIVHVAACAPPQENVPLTLADPVGAVVTSGPHGHGGRSVWPLWWSGPLRPGLTDLPRCGCALWPIENPSCARLAAATTCCTAAAPSSFLQGKAQTGAAQVTSADGLRGTAHAVQIAQTTGSAHTVGSTRAHHVGDGDADLDAGGSSVRLPRTEPCSPSAPAPQLSGCTLHRDAVDQAVHRGVQRARLSRWCGNSDLATTEAHNGQRRPWHASV